MTTFDRKGSDGRIRESYGARGGGASGAANSGAANGGASVRDAQRVLARHGGAAPSTGGGSLETQSTATTPPRLEGTPLIEGTRIEVRDLPGEPIAACGGFLDGIQRSVVAWYLRAMLPVVHATVAAAIRTRDDRTLRTWADGPLIERALYLPVALAGRELVGALDAAGVAVRDTLPPDDTGAARHPQELIGLARQGVQERRAQLEEQLATAWCAREQSPLYVDGGIGGFADASRSPLAIGVVKSHRTLYVAAEAIATLAALEPGQRSSAFHVATRRRARVASWYLRLRADGDPLGGMVRVEVAEAGFNTARADLVSRWVLAEREPVALPDSRWRVMAYGIRDCEEYLRAVAG